MRSAASDSRVRGRQPIAVVAGVRPTGVVGLAIVAIAAAAVHPARAVDGAIAQDAEALFQRMEQSLLERSTLQLTTEVRSEGAFESSLEGSVWLEAGNRATFDVAGSFGGPADLRLASDGERLRGGSAAGEFDVATPAHLNEAIVIGLTRMGILHNLARLVGGAPPDHMEGGVQDWVQVVEVRTEPEEDADGRALRRFDFGLVVDGVRSGTASLWVDAESSLPVRREQTVQFDEGEMRVTEVYRFSGSP